MLVVFVPLQFPLVWADLSLPVGITQERTDFDSDCALFTSETECGHPSQLRLHLSNLLPGLGAPDKSPTSVSPLLPGAGLPMKGPVLKQRHFSLLALNSQESFEIICEYPLRAELLYLK